MRDKDRELERVLSTHAAALSRLAASYESRPALREELLQDIAFALWRAPSHIAARKGDSHHFGDAEKVTVPFLQAVDPGPRPEEEVANMQGAVHLHRGKALLKAALGEGP